MSTSAAPRAHGRLPHGFAVRLAHDTVVCDGGLTLLGGSSGRLVHLKPAAVGALGGSDRLVVTDAVSATLARMLLDRGLADPAWESGAGDDAVTLDDVTVVVPAHGRAAPVTRLLGALPDGVRVVLVDDASPDPGPLARTAERFGATLVRRDANGGPAAARNSGLAVVWTPYVVFLDSDVVPARGALAHLRRHFEDPALGMVAPRVLSMHDVGADEGRGWLARYEAARSSLDLGPRPGRVASHSRIGYVPSAALMARTCAVAGGFEESMRVAEDVDLVWRVGSTGWQVRYDPGAVVRHDHRTDTTEWLSRKAFYGTGAALLAERHGDAVAPMVLTPWTAVVTGAILAQRRWSLPVAAVATGAAVVSTARKLPHSHRPLPAAATMVSIGLVATVRQTMSSLLRHHWPVAVAAAAVSPRARRALAVAAVVDAVLDHRESGTDLDPLRWFVARRADDLAYGAGVWWGVARRLGTTRPGDGRRRTRAGLALVPAVRGLPTRRRPVAPAGESQQRS